MLKHNIPAQSPILDEQQQVHNLAELIVTLPQAILVKGGAGIGKSSLAYHAALEAGRRVEPIFDFVFQLTAKTRYISSAGDILDPLSRFLGNTAASSASRDSVKVELLSEELQNRRGLLVLDNAESIAPRVLDLIGSLNNDLHILYTSTQFLDTDDPPQVFSIKPLADSDIRSILHTYSVAASADTDKVVQALMQLIGGNPLAAKWVGAQLRKGVRPSYLVESLSGGTDDIFRTLFNANWSALSPLAKRALLLLPSCASSVDQSLLANATAFADARGEVAVAELYSVSLVDIARLGTEAARVSLHPLTRSFALGHFSEYDEEERVQHFLSLDRSLLDFCFARHTLDKGRAAYDQLDDEIDTVIMRLSDIADEGSNTRYPGWQEQYLALTDAVNVFFWRRGMWEERVRFCETAATVAEVAGLPVDAARQYSNAGIVRYWQGDTPAASEFADRAEACLQGATAKPVQRAFTLRLRALVNHAEGRSQQGLIDMLTVLEAINESDRTDAIVRDAVRLFSDWPCAGPEGYRSGEIAILAEIGIIYTDLAATRGSLESEEETSAQYWLSKAIHVAELIGDDEGRAMALSHRGRCVQRSDPQAAESDFTVASLLAQSVGRRSTQGRALLGLGLAGPKLDRVRALQSAARIFTQLRMRRELDVCREHLAALE